MCANKPNDNTQTPSPHEDGLLAECPLCRYALTGLPVIHYCPECGCPVDRRWQLFGGESSHMVRRLRSAGLVVVRLVLLAYLFSVTWATLRELGAESMPGLIVLLINTGIAVLVLASFRRRRAFVAFGPAGLDVVEKGDRQTRHEWRSLGRAQFVLAKSAVRISTSARAVLLRSEVFFGGSGLEADRFVQAFNAYPRPIQDSVMPSTTGTSAND